MSKSGKAKDDDEIEKCVAVEKTKLLAEGKSEVAVEQRIEWVSTRPACAHSARPLPSLEEARFIEGTHNNEETELRKETNEKQGRARGTYAIKPRTRENGNGQRALSLSTYFAAGGLNNYGAIRRTVSKKGRFLPSEGLQSARLLSKDWRPSNMSEYRNRRYSAVSAPAVSLLTSIADDDEDRTDDQPIRPPPVIRFEEAPKTKTRANPVPLRSDGRTSRVEEGPNDESVFVTPSKQTTSTTATSASADSRTKKSVDELRRVLEKRWDQLARHRLVILHVVLVAYILTFVIAYICVFHGRTRLPVLLVLWSLIGYCTVLVLLCVACPAISARPIFLSLSSVTTATLWPVLIWVLTLCWTQDDFHLWHDKGINWIVNGLPDMLLFIFALYGTLTFPRFIDTIWGLFASILHIILTYINRQGNDEDNAQEICAITLILLVANAFNLFVSLYLRRSREFMWREFDDAIEKRATVEYEKQRQEQLLLSIIPAHLAARVRKTIMNRASKTRESIDNSGDHPRLFHDLHVQQHENVSILFADIVNFTPLTTELTAPQLVRFLNELYSRFDELAQEYQCMRIKILGDCYYCVSGMPVSRPNHADNCVKMALAMIEAIKSLKEATGINMDMRIGVHSGSVLCGVLGLKKWQYDIWSDDVTIANHMEQGGRPGKVHITKETLQILSGDYQIIPANTTDPYILAQCLETYFILPYSASQAEIASATPSSVEDLFGTVNGFPGPLVQLTEAPVEQTQTNHGRRRESKKDNKQLKVFTPSNRPFDRPKSFSFRQYHGTTDLGAAREKAQRRLGPSMMKNNAPSCENFANTQYRQTAKMSKIIEFWGGADTPFSNLSRRRSSDHVRAASITAIENNYTQYRCWNVISTKSKCWSTSMERISKVWRRDNHRREASPGASLLLDGTLTYGDGSVEESFYKNAEPIPYPASTTAVAIVTLFIGVIGMTCILSKPDLAASAIFGTILVFLVLWSIFQWNRTRGWKINYMKFLSAVENYEGFSKRVIPSLVLLLSMALPMVFLSVCEQLRTCFNTQYDVCLFQLTLLLVVCTCRPGVLTRCGLVIVFFIAFASMFLYSTNVSDEFSSSSTETIRNGSAENDTAQSNEQTLFSFKFRSMVEMTTLIILVISISWLIEYEAKVDWLCVTSFRVEQEDVETMQDINMILLHNILPAHVAAHFLRPARPPEELYHENHAYVCVMFASIPNFKDFWSQWDFTRQLECLRLLNEIVCEFDKLLAKPKYSNVEKIKTVGSTYMAVCGLFSNPALQLDPRRYAAIMVEFAFTMITLLDQLNRDAFQNFQLRIGMSFGPVIAGVIGAQKPQYDIWGNTVNVASRMDTHGVMGRIHVTKDAATALQACGYEVESRGLIKIKGIRNEVETYFVRPPSDKRSLAY